MPSPGTDTRTPLTERPPLAVVVEGDGAELVHEIAAEHPLVLVGRAAQSDLLLSNIGVSRRHALLVRWDRAVYCMDLGSRGGTLIGRTGDRQGWLTRHVSAEIGPYQLRAAAAPETDAHLPILHRQRLAFDRLQDWQLEFVSGDIQPPTYVLRRPLTLIGRKPPCKIQLKLPKIQSVHAALLVTPDGLYVRDLSGRCEVRVDGQSRLGAWLQDGQIIELGKVRIRVTQVPAAPAPRASEAETDDPIGSATQPATAPLRSAAQLHPMAELPADASSEQAPASAPEARSDDLEESSAESTTTSASQERSYADVVLGGRYKIIDRLARGGMGVVYKGLDVRLHRIVAIKVVRASGVDADHPRRRLLREAMVSSRFDHPAIARVLDVDKQGRFAVFEYLSGETLADRLRRDGRIPPVEAANWMAHVADAIDHAASRGVVHRDIKPMNVLIAPGGIAKLVDFGLAYLEDVGDSETLAVLTEQTERPRRGIAIGTAPFASPEQFADSQSVDTRSDIYSAGCTLFTLLAGRTPFGGSVTETYRKHREDPVPAMPNVPEELTTIVEKCLAKNPADRYQTGAELAAALRAFNG